MGGSLHSMVERLLAMYEHQMPLLPKLHAPLTSAELQQTLHLPCRWMDSQASTPMTYSSFTSSRPCIQGAQWSA